MKRQIKNLFCLTLTLSVLITAGYYGASRTSTLNTRQITTPIVYSQMV